MILRSAAAEEAKTLNAAGYNPTTASSTQNVTVAAVVSRDDAPRDIVDYALKLIHSGESDGATDSKKTTAVTEPDVAKP